ncbi:MAG: hypothetical protein R3B70_31020 [Polyangiaceae bacterium]
MGTFDIRFLNDRPPVPPYDGAVGEISIDSFRERFVVDLSFWSRDRYMQQWVKAARDIVQKDRTALITSLVHPSSASFISWWALYRDGESVVVQQQLCFIDALDRPFDPERVEEFVSPRETTSEDGQEISEWLTTLEDVTRFAARASPPV